jgi:tetratricopeptide (TPR) repeat protein
MQEGRWAEAVPHWEVLHLLHPDQSAYANKLAETQSLASHAAAEHLQAAQQARQQGQTERAAVLYLKALSADPGNAEAAQGLRDIEKESARKAYAGAAGRGGNSETVMRSGSKPAPLPSATERRDLDSAIMLLHQGDYSAAVQTLESYLRKYPRDDLGRRTLQDAYVELARRRAQEGKKEEALAYLEKAHDLRDKSSPELTRSIQSLYKEIAEDYYQQGLRAQPTNLGEAIRLWEECLKYNPDHVQAARRLERARRMEQNLRSIPDSSSTP